MKSVLLTHFAIVFGAACFAQQPAPQTSAKRFDSPDAAAQALIDDTDKHDAAGLAAIFGPQGNPILTSGNPSQDRAEQSQFSQLARARHQLIPDSRNPNRVILSIGDEDSPFPVPIVRSNGKWSFDVSQTHAEMQPAASGPMSSTPSK